MKEIFSKIFENSNNPKDPQIVKSGVGNLIWIHPDRNSAQRIEPHESNIKHLEKLGISPLSFREIRDQLDGDPKTWVLFDTGVDVVHLGNHWRVLEENTNTQEITLQFCAPYGKYDFDKIQPFTLPTTTPFFSGVSVHHYVHKTEGELTLQRAIELHQQSSSENNLGKLPIHHSETIFWVQEARPFLGPTKNFLPHGE